jgi:hypothetical protein
MQDNYLTYEELRQAVIAIVLTTKYDVVCYMVAVDMPIKAYAINCIERLAKDGLLNG